MWSVDLYEELSSYPVEIATDNAEKPWKPSPRFYFNELMNKDVLEEYIVNRFNDDDIEAMLSGTKQIKRSSEEPDKSYTSYFQSDEYYRERFGLGRKAYMERFLCTNVTEKDLEIDSPERRNRTVSSEEEQDEVTASIVESLEAKNMRPPSYFQSDEYYSKRFSLKREVIMKRCICNMASETASSWDEKHDSESLPSLDKDSDSTHETNSEMSGSFSTSTEDRWTPPPRLDSKCHIKEHKVKNPKGPKVQEFAAQVEKSPQVPPYGVKGPFRIEQRVKHALKAMITEDSVELGYSHSSFGDEEYDVEYTVDNDTCESTLLTDTILEESASKEHIVLEIPQDLTTIPHLGEDPNPQSDQSRQMHAQQEMLRGCAESYGFPLDCVSDFFIEDLSDASSSDYSYTFEGSLELRSLSNSVTL